MIPDRHAVNNEAFPRYGALSIRCYETPFYGRKSARSQGVAPCPPRQPRLMGPVSDISSRRDSEEERGGLKSRVAIDTVYPYWLGAGNRSGMISAAINTNGG